MSRVEFTKYYDYLDNQRFAFGKIMHDYTHNVHESHTWLNHVTQMAALFKDQNNSVNNRNLVRYI